MIRLWAVFNTLLNYLKIVAEKSNHNGHVTDQNKKTSRSAKKSYWSAIHPKLSSSQNVTPSHLQQADQSLCRRFGYACEFIE